MKNRRERWTWRSVAKRMGALLLCAVILAATPARALDLDKLGYPEEYQKWVRSTEDVALGVTPETARDYLDAIAQRKQEIQSLGNDYSGSPFFESCHVFSSLIDIDKDGSAELIMRDGAPDWSGSGNPSGNVIVYSGSEQILRFGEDYRECYFALSPPYLLTALGFPASSGNWQESDATLYRLEAGQLAEVTKRFLNYGAILGAAEPDDPNTEVTVSYTDEAGMVQSVTDQHGDFDMSSLPNYTMMEMVDQIKAEVQQKGIDLNSPMIAEYSEEYSSFQYPHGYSSWDSGTEQILQGIIDAETRGEHLVAPTAADFKEIAETVALYSAIFEWENADLTQGEYPPVEIFFHWMMDRSHEVVSSFDDPAGLQKFVDTLEPEYAALIREETEYDISIYETNQTAMDLTLRGLYGDTFDTGGFYRNLLDVKNITFPVHSKDGKWYCAVVDVGMDFGDYNVTLNTVSDLGNGLYAAYLSEFRDNGEGLSYDGAFTMLLRRAPDGSAISFQVLKIAEGNIDATTVNAIKNRVLASNAQYDYQQVSGFTTTQEYIDYLDGRLKGLNGTVINDKGKLETAQYIQFLYENATVSTVSAKRNHLILNVESLKTAAESHAAIQDQVNTLLNQYQVGLNKDLQVTLKVLASGLDTSKGATVELDRSALEALKGAQTLRILFDGAGTGFGISVADMELALSTSESLRFTLGQKDGAYELNFLDGEGKVQSKADAPITLYLPADTPYASVEVTYGDYLENWGGQYDGKNALIFFSTSLSGLYTVMESEVPILDIDALTEEQQSIIRFLVSRGIFAAEGGAFTPDARLNRYSFTEALVKMFYALDREAVCSFTDVPADSGHYPYIASAEQTGIAAGIGHGLFAGDAMVTRETVLTFCARTLVDKKGYQYPEDMSRYANFTDRDAIAPWALASVALAEQLGLISGGGVLEPQGELTRAESAELLYRLYMLLYEVAPTETRVDALADSLQGSILPSALCFGIAACVAAAAAVLLIPRRIREQLGVRGKKLLLVGSVGVVVAGVVGGVLLLPPSGPSPAPVVTLSPRVSVQPTQAVAPTPTNQDTDAATYIFPSSNQTQLTDTDVAGLSSTELARGRNELFARHGRIFSDPELSAYFASKPWYHGEIAPDQFDESVFNEIERGNIAFLKATQKKVEFADNAHLFAEKIERVQANYFIPESRKSPVNFSIEEVKQLLDSGKTPLLCLRLVDLNQDGVPALLLAYLTNDYPNVVDSNGLPNVISARWELWTLEKDQMVCSAKEDVYADDIGGGQHHILSLHANAEGQEDKLVSVHFNTPINSRTIYSFVSEESTNQYCFEENGDYERTDENRFLEATRNKEPLSNPQAQMNQCNAILAESVPLLEMDYSNGITVYDDLRGNMAAVLNALEQYQ